MLCLNRFSLTDRFARIVMAGILLGSLAGCSSFGLTKSIPFLGDYSKPEQPSSIVAVWADSILHEPNSTPMRGFAGRLIFYGEDDAKPVKVKGSLTVYAFDEQGRKDGDVKPDRKYVFTEEDLAKHYTKEKIGPCYTVWLPWDEAGGPKKEISLIVRFVPKGGRLVVGEQTRHALLGTAADEPQNVAGLAPSQDHRSSPAMNPGNGNQGVQQVSFESTAPNMPGQPGAPGQANAAMQAGQGMASNRSAALTTTIPLPENFGRGSFAPSQSMPAPRGTTLPANPAAATNGIRATMNAPANAMASTRGMVPGYPQNAYFQAAAQNGPSPMMANGRPAMTSSPFPAPRGTASPARSGGNAAATSPSPAAYSTWGQPPAFHTSNDRPMGTQMLQPSSRFPLERSPVPGGQAAQPTLDRVPLQQSPEGSPYLPASQFADPSARGPA
jgi:hypothetical protein